MDREEKFEKITKGYNPYYMGFLALLFSYIWIYGIWNCNGFNFHLWIIGMTGTIISLFYAIDFVIDRKVYWRKIK